MQCHQPSPGMVHNQTIHAFNNRKPMPEGVDCATAQVQVLLLSKLHTMHAFSQRHATKHWERQIMHTFSQ